MQMAMRPQITLTPQTLSTEVVHSTIVGGDSDEIPNWNYSLVGPGFTITYPDAMVWFSLTGSLPGSLPAANNGTQQPKSPAQHPKSPAQQQCENAQKNAQANFNAINQNFYKKAYKNALEGILIGGIAGCIITAEIGCAEGGLPGAAIGGLGGAAKSMVQDLVWETVDTILANQQCEGVQ